MVILTPGDTANKSRVVTSYPMTRQHAAPMKWQTRESCLTLKKTECSVATALATHGHGKYSFPINKSRVVTSSASTCEVLDLLVTWELTGKCWKLLRVTCLTEKWEQQLLHSHNSNWQHLMTLKWKLPQMHTAKVLNAWPGHTLLNVSQFSFNNSVIFDTCLTKSYDTCLTKP